MAGSYKPDSHGLRELGMSGGVGDAMVEAAERGRRWAEGVAPSWARDGGGAFRVEPAVVQAGWKNEDRAGAALINDVEHAFKGRGNVLQRAVNVIEGGA